MKLFIYWLFKPIKLPGLMPVLCLYREGEIISATNNNIGEDIVFTVCHLVIAPINSQPLSIN